MLFKTVYCINAISLVFIYTIRTNIDEKHEILVLLRHYWKKCFTSVARANQICDVEGEDMINVRIAQHWLNTFKG